MQLIAVSGINAQGDKFSSIQKTIDRFPDECPLCHVTITPENILQGFIVKDLLEMFFRCVNPKCCRSFISLYRFDQGLSQGKQFQHYNFERSLPVEPKQTTVSEDITALSPSFVKIFAQAQTAEDHGLDEIAGPGFRKALEFLIKDYAISITTDEDAKKEIRKVLLNVVITKYLCGDKLPIISKRAAWLGNDETHYERRWVGKDLTDLKNLIAAVEHFIAMERLVITLPIEMPDPR